MIGDIYYRFNDLAYSWVANESWTWHRNLPPLPVSELQLSPCVRPPMRTQADER